jgi:hypothetical protein
MASHHSPSLASNLVSPQEKIHHPPSLDSRIQKDIEANDKDLKNDPVLDEKSTSAEAVQPP